MKIDITGYKQGLYKSTGGLIRVFLKEGDGRIDEVLFTGDFFIFPEESLDMMARSLKGVTLNRDAILNNIKEIYLREDIDSPGTTPKDFANAIMAAIE